MHHAIHNPDSRMSSDRFSHPGKVQSGDIYEVFRNSDEPVLNTSDFDEAIDWASRSTVRRELEDMRDSGKLVSKKGGTNPNAGEVWYPVGEVEEIPQATPDPIKLVYQHPWFSLLTVGFFFIGFGFILFMPGYFGEGRYFGVLNRNILVQASLFLYISGVVMVAASTGLIIGKNIEVVIQNRR